MESVSTETDIAKSDNVLWQGTEMTWIGLKRTLHNCVLKRRPVPKGKTMHTSLVSLESHFYGSDVVSIKVKILLYGVYDVHEIENYRTKFIITKYY